MFAAIKVKPILVLGYGNPSRGDDALGPLSLDLIERRLDKTKVELQTDFQLQIEHALDLQLRELVLFIDASVVCATDFEFIELKADRDNSYTTHSMSPSAILLVYQSITGCLPPPSFLLSIQGSCFELGSGLSDQAVGSLNKAVDFAEQLLKNPHPSHWRLQTLVEDYSA